MQTAHSPRTLPRAAAITDPYMQRRRASLYSWFAALCVERGVRRVLDAGCGDGLGAAILAAAGLDVVAIDVDDDALAVAARTHRSRRLAFRRADASRAGLPSATFDAAISASVIEHLRDPMSAVREAARLVADGGTVVVVTPNRLTASPGRTVPIAVDHEWEFTCGELASLTSKAFERTRMLGLFHGPRSRLVGRATGARLDETARRVPPVDRAGWLASAIERWSDFEVRPGKLRNALDLICVGMA